MGERSLFAKRSGITKIAELIGHEQGCTLSVYAPMQLPISELKELIKWVKYPGLRLNHLRMAKVHGARHGAREAVPAL